MEGDWARLIRFMVTSQLNESQYYGIRGTEVLNLANYDEEGRVIARGKSQLVLKTKEGKIQVLCCCQIPCLTIRLAVMANEDDIPVEADNEYADKVVGYLVDQIDACWKVLPEILNRSHLGRMYIRKFERYTATLHLGGIREVGLNDIHKQPMRDELLRLNQLNFNHEHKREQWGKLPLLNFSCNEAKDGYNEYDCCREESVDGDDSDNGGDDNNSLDDSNFEDDDYNSSEDDSSSSDDD